MNVAPIVVGLGVWIALFAFWWKRRERKVATRTPNVAAEPKAEREREPDLEKLFTTGAVFEDEKMTVRVERIATLHLPTGKIVACDPLVSPETRPFQRAVAPGDYRVDASIALVGPGHERIAAVRVVFQEAAAVSRWECDPTTYCVDAGLGCFMDATAGKRLEAAMRELPDDQNYYDDVLAHELENPTREWTDHRPGSDKTRRENVVVVHSGWGDGVYASYWGLDDAGAPVYLVTDFGVA